MSYLLRSIEHNRLLISKTFSLQRNNLLETSSVTLCRTRAKASYNIMMQAPLSTSQKPPDQKSTEQKSRKVDNIKYEIKFKQPTDVKKLFKDLYSLYGPLFIACHIGISLLSVGFFFSIVSLTVDPTKYIPDSVLVMIGQNMSDVTASGSKFVLAYAIHKIILPVRIFTAIWLTRKLSKVIKLRRPS